MPQFYSLDEASKVLGMSPEDLQAKAQQREVRAFMDNGEWRFRVADVDELARRRGESSDPDLAIPRPDPHGSVSDSGSEDFDLSDFQLGVTAPKTPDPSDLRSSSDNDILLDDISLPPNPMTSASSTIIGMEPAGRRPGDSDVRLVPDAPKGASDSDVRLRGDGPRPPSDSDVTLVSDEFAPPGSSDEAIPVAGPADTSVRKSPATGSSGEIKAGHGDPDSEFELTSSSTAGMVDALQPDSGSDFELTALDASDEFESAPIPKPSDSDVTAGLPADSGINLAKPSDSGINLQGFGGLDLDDADSIELAPLDEEGPAPAPAPPPPKPAAASAKPKVDMSATALPTKKDKDIFEDTDFEVDALDAGGHEDRTIQLDAASDFDLDESESGSEVFAIDEDDVDQNAATSLAPAVLEEEEEASDDGFDVSPDADESDEEGEAWDVENETPPAAASGRGGAAPAPALVAAAPAAEWGGLWVGFLMVATVLMLFLAFLSMDLVRNMYGYKGNTSASGLVKSIAGIAGG